MSWERFIYYALVSALCWLAGAYFGFREKLGLAMSFTGLGTLVFFVYIVGMWIALERPPLRTMGETRLWYSFFLSIIGVVLYAKCRYRWVLGFSTLMSLVFVLVNLLKPEIHSNALMPNGSGTWHRALHQ